MEPPPPNKRQRETTEPPNLSDVLRLAREMWFPTDPYKQRSDKEEDRDMRECFGAPAQVVVVLFGLLLQHDLLPPGGTLRHLLWTLHHWKSNDSKRKQCKFCGGIDKNTLHKWTGEFRYAIALLEGEVIVWEDRKTNDRGADCYCTMDMVDFRVPNYGPIFSSHKFAKKGGVRYELCICIQTGDLVWINGPFACGRHNEITIFRKALISHLDEYEMLETDDSFVGEAPRHIKCPKSFTNPEQTLFMQQRVRNRQETINKRAKDWKILVDVYKDDLTTHGDVVRGILIVEQLKINNGQPLFSCGYRNLTDEEIDADL